MQTNQLAAIVKKYLKTLDKDLQVQIVFSCVSLNPTKLLEAYDVANKVQYIRGVDRIADPIKRAEQQAAQDKYLLTLDAATNYHHAVPVQERFVN